MYPWQRLLARAVQILEGTGLGRGDWTWGGGTLLAFRYGHRDSRDIDLFLNDVQHLSRLSPRLNDVTAWGTLGYSESGNSLRLGYPGGEIDFLAVAPLFPGIAPEQVQIDGIPGFLQAMPDIEILGQKLYYRAAGFSGRDLYDFTAVTRARPVLLEDPHLQRLALDRRDALEMSLESPQCRRGFAALARPRLSVSFGEARALLLGWLARAAKEQVKEHKTGNQPPPR